MKFKLFLCSLLFITNTNFCMEQAANVVPYDFRPYRELEEFYNALATNPHKEATIQQLVQNIGNRNVTLKRMTSSALDAAAIYQLEKDMNADLKDGDALVDEIANKDSNHKQELLRLCKKGFLYTRQYNLKHPVVHAPVNFSEEMFYPEMVPFLGIVQLLKKKIDTFQKSMLENKKQEQKAIKQNHYDNVFYLTIAKHEIVKKFIIELVKHIKNESKQEIISSIVVSDNDTRYSSLSPIIIDCIMYSDPQAREACAGWLTMYKKILDQ